jgi:hypothetical protein
MEISDSSFQFEKAVISGEEGDGSSVGATALEDILVV